MAPSPNIEVPRWLLRLLPLPMWLVVGFLAFLVWLFYVGGGFGALVLALVVSGAETFLSRYFIRRTTSDGDRLRITYLGGRTASVAPEAVRLAPGSAWRFAFYGGTPVVDRRSGRLKGAFYPTIKDADELSFHLWLERQT